MDTVGQRLQKARVAKELSVSEIAQTTRIKAMQVEAIERDDFSAVPAVAYGKGFVKLLAQALDLDAAELVEQYVVQVGAQPIAPKARATKSSQPAPSPVSASAPMVEPESISSSGDAPADGAVERTAADRSRDRDTLTLGGLSGSGNDSAGGLDFLQRYWKFAAGLAVLALALLVIPKLLSGGEADAGEGVFEELPEIESPRNVEPLFPYIELPESSS